ncbi:MAG TPA: FHA domain-containing protein, partial [Amaricoccus sp.]|nr:FHA domain-containing protein [Amaricoccus sp.]
MSLLLSLVRAPRPQQVRQMRLSEGELVIGRSAEADWRIDDPDQYVSRAHCTIFGQDGAFTVTDTSSGGLFVDEDRRPLGSGRSVPLRDGMRLRLGDYVVQVELRAEAGVAAAPAPSRSASLDDGFFSAPL